MISVIKHGILPENQVYIFKKECPHCSCVFEFELEDCIKIEKRLDGFMTVVCPDCGRELKVSRDTLNYRIISKGNNING